MNVFCVSFCTTYFTVKSSDFSWCAAKIIAALLKLQKEKKLFKQVCFMLLHLFYYALRRRVTRNLGGSSVGLLVSLIPAAGGMHAAFHHHSDPILLT